MASVFRKLNSTSFGSGHTKLTVLFPSRVDVFLIEETNGCGAKPRAPENRREVKPGDAARRAARRRVEGRAQGARAGCEVGGQGREILLDITASGWPRGRALGMRLKRSGILSKCIDARIQKKLKFRKVVDPGNPFFRPPFWRSLRLYQSLVWRHCLGPLHRHCFGPLHRLPLLNTFVFVSRN